MKSGNHQESDKFVFLVGAGFSTQFGPPVMAAFMDKARRVYHERKKSGAASFVLPYYEKMFRFYEDCKRGSGSAFNRNWDNIEELYTQADLLRLAQLSHGEESPDELCQSVAWSIWDVYRKCEPWNDGLSGIFGRIQNELNLSPIIITTNYDIFIEKTLPRTEPQWRYFYHGFEEPVQTHAFRFESDNPHAAKKNEIPIIKLHGSVNWFSVKNSWVWVTNLIEEGAVDNDAFDFGGLESALLQVFQKRGVQAEENQTTPAIVPPMLGKSSLSNVIARQWKKAIEAISQARQIWVIGYSFPSTDTFMPRLFAEGIQTNSDLERLVICDIQPQDRWEERLRTIFVPTFRDTRVKYFSVNAFQILEIMRTYDCNAWLAWARRRDRENELNRPFQP